MKAFAYVNATNEPEALAALGTQRGKVLPLAGGMDLVGLMKDRVVSPDRVVNVKGLPSAIAIPPQGTATIGAAARLADVAAHEAVRRQFPAFAEASGAVGTPQIRNLGTVGGNLCQRPRCWYFRNEEFHCLKKGGGRCFAVDGENQFHAIFGEGPCHIVHPSSLAVPLIALGGSIRVAGPNGSREVPAEDFFVMPDRSLFAENVLAPNELVTQVSLPVAAATRSATYEVRYRQSHDWPIAFASVALAMDGPTVKSARVVLGAVAPTPWRARAAEEALAGKRIIETVAQAAAEAALADASPMSGNGYKVQVAKTAVKRAIMRAAGLPTV